LPVGEDPAIFFLVTFSLNKLSIRYNKLGFYRVGVKEDPLNKIAISLLGIMLASGFALPASARDISGKVVAVYEEPVTLNAKTWDKVSVTVNNCATNQWETVSYSPGNIADDNSLGFLFNDLANAARSMVSKTQYMNSVSGHVTLTVNEQNVVQKTMFWGYNWECGQDIDGRTATTSPSAGGTAPSTAPASQAPSNPMNKFRKFGF
jgi:hypothetical protein